MSSDGKAIKSGIWYTLSSFLISGISFILAPVFNRIMTMDEVGMYSNYSAIYAIVSVITSLRLEASLIRARYDYESEFNDYVFSITVLSSSMALLFIVLSNVLGIFAFNVTGVERGYLILMGLSLFFYPAITSMIAKERYEFNYKSSVIVSLLLSVGTSFLSLFLVLNFHNKYFGRVLGMVFPTVIIGFFIYLLFLKDRCHLRITYWKYAIPVSIPSIPHVLSLSILNSFDRIMITNMCGSTENALYSTAYNCGVIVTVLISSMNSAYAPWLGEKLHQKDYKTICSFSRHYILFFCSFTLLIILFAPEVLLVMGGQKYLDAKFVIPPIIMGCFCQFVYSMYVSIEQYSRKTVRVAIGSVIAASLNYVLNMVFIPQYGYLAAAFTTLFGYFFLMIYNMIMVRVIGLKDANDNGFVYLISTVMMVFTVLSEYLYSNDSIRYPIAFLYCVLLIYVFIRKRDVLVQFVRKMKQK